MAAKLLSQFKQRISGLDLVPASGGCFELTANGNLVYSKLATGQFPNEDSLVAEIGNLLAKK